MAGDWEVVELGSLASDQDGAIAIGPFGSAMKAENYTADGVPVIRGTNISSSRELGGDWVFIPDAFADAMPRCVTRSGDLVFPHRGSVGEVALVPNHPGRYFLSTSFMKITLDKRKADPRFMVYFFKSNDGRAEIMRFASQVGTPGIGQPLTSLRQFKVPCPPLPVQSAIADFLWLLDDKIELNRRMVDTLEAMARALFRSWFIDFDPIHARIESRSTGLPDNLTALFPNNFGEGGGGLPEAWAGVTDDIAELVRVSVQPRDVEPTTPYVGLEHMERGSIILYRHGFASDVDSLKHRFMTGDFLFGKLRPYFNKTAIAPFDGVCSSDIFVFRARAGMPASLLYLCFSDPAFVANASNASSGTRMPRADWDYMRRLPAALPSPQLAVAFERAVRPLLHRMVAIAQECSTLTCLRDTLLPKLVSGKLRIADAERRIAAA